MSFYYHEFKNHINRDPLSDWFDKVNDTNGGNMFQKDEPNEFQIDLQKKKEEYIKEFISHLKEEITFYENLDHQLNFVYNAPSPPMQS